MTTVFLVPADRAASRTADWLLNALLDDRSREAVIGDLHEGYLAVRQDRGAADGALVVLAPGGSIRDGVPHHRPAADRITPLRL